MLPFSPAVRAVMPCPCPVRAASQGFLHVECDTSYCTPIRRVKTCTVQCSGRCRRLNVCHITCTPCRPAGSQLRDPTWRHAMMTQCHSVACHADDKRWSAFAHSRMICSPGTTAQHATFLSGPGSARLMHAGRCPCPLASVLRSFCALCVDPPLQLRRTEAPPSLLRFTA